MRTDVGTVSKRSKAVRDRASPHSHAAAALPTPAILPLQAASSSSSSSHGDSNCPEGNPICQLPSLHPLLRHKSGSQWPRLRIIPKVRRTHFWAEVLNVRFSHPPLFLRLLRSATLEADTFEKRFWTVNYCSRYVVPYFMLCTVNII